MKKWLEIIAEGTIYCVVMVVIIFLMSVDYDKQIKNIRQEKQQIQIKYQQLEKENNMLKQQLKQQNNINFQILTSTIGEIQILKDSNQKLNKEIATLISKQKKTKEDSKKVIGEDQPVQMMYFGKKNNK